MRALPPQRVHHDQSRWKSLIFYIPIEPQRVPGYITINIPCAQPSFGNPVTQALASVPHAGDDIYFEAENLLSQIRQEADKATLVVVTWNEPITGCLAQQLEPVLTIAPSVNMASHKAAGSVICSGPLGSC